MKLLVVAPVNDAITQDITSVWAGEIVDFARGLGIVADVYIGTAVTRTLVEPGLQACLGEEGLFCFLDHGTNNALLGANFQPLLDSANIHLLRNKFIYTIACLAGNQLGPESIQQGVRGFLGFTEKVYVHRDRAQMMGRCLAIGIQALLQQGENAGQAFTAIGQEITNVIEQMDDEEDPFQDDASVVLLHNQKALTLLGDRDWRWR